MNLTEARQLVRLNSQNAGSSDAYSDTMIDLCIMSLFKIACQDARMIRKSGTCTFVAGQDTFDLTHLFEQGFAAHRLQGIFLVSGNSWTSKISMTDMETIAQLRTQPVPNQPMPISSQPAFIAFEQTSDTFGQVWPTPSTSNSYNGKIMWHAPYPSWRPGAAGDDIDISAPDYIEMPDEFARALLTQGVPAMLQRQEPEKQATVVLASQWYRDWISRLRDQGSLGGNMVVPRGLIAW